MAMLWVRITEQPRTEVHEALFVNVDSAAGAVVARGVHQVNAQDRLLVQGRVPLAELKDCGVTFVETIDIDFKCAANVWLVLGVTIKVAEDVDAIDLDGAVAAVGIAAIQAVVFGGRTVADRLLNVLGVTVGLAGGSCIGGECKQWSEQCESEAQHEKGCAFHGWSF